MRKKLALILILAFIMVAGGCGTVETDKPTETTAEDDNLLDSDGFRASYRKNNALHGVYLWGNHPFNQRILR